MVFSQTHDDWNPQSQLYSGKLYTMPAYLTQRKLNKQQIMAYPSEKQYTIYNIPKNKSKF